MTTTTKHHIERLRWEKRRRTLRVINITRLTPHMQRITLQSDELHDFASLAHDDHVKILLPVAGEAVRRLGYALPAQHSAFKYRIRAQRPSVGLMRRSPTYALHKHNHY